jgi:hypothetical protein
MTIGIGFKCDDGILLAADTQYTKGAYKGHGPKIFPLFNGLGLGQERSDLSVVIAGSGRVAFMTRAIEKLEPALGSLTDPTFGDIQHVLEEELLDFYETYIYPKPDSSREREERYGFELLIGVWAKAEPSKFQLFKSEDVTVNKVQGKAAIGMGFSVADYALDLMHQYPLSVDGTIFPAALAIKAAKDHVDYCGGHTIMWTIRGDAKPRRVQRVSGDEVLEAEEYSEEMFEAVRDLVAFIEPETISVGISDPAQKIMDFKHKQQERRAKRERMLQRIAENKAKRQGHGSE